MKHKRKMLREAERLKIYYYLFSNETWDKGLPFQQQICQE